MLLQSTYPEANRKRPNSTDTKPDARALNLHGYYTGRPGQPTELKKPTHLLSGDPCGWRHNANRKQNNII